MNSRTKSDEVQFYLDRSQEALVTILRSILDNPRLPVHEKFEHMHKLGEHHRAIATLIENKLAEGERRGLELAAQASSRSVST